MNKFEFTDEEVLALREIVGNCCPETEKERKIGGAIFDKIIPVADAILEREKAKAKKTAKKSKPTAADALKALIEALERDVNSTDETEPPADELITDEDIRKILTDLFNN